MKTFVCFGAHPDDLEFSCTATNYKLIQQGYQGIFVVITTGENGFKGPETPREGRIEIRRQEQQNAAKKLGVSDVIFLDHRDGFLEYTEELRRQLVEIIKTYKPEIVFSFDPANRDFDDLNLFHRDHRIVGEAVFDACFAAKNRFMYPGEPHTVGQLWLYGSYQPTHFEDITDLIDFKMELLACHASQFPDFSLVDDFVRNEISKFTDMYVYSEGFRVMTVRQLT